MISFPEKPVRITGNHLLRADDGDLFEVAHGRFDEVSGLYCDVLDAIEDKRGTVDDLPDLHVRRLGVSIRVGDLPGPDQPAKLYCSVRSAEDACFALHFLQGWVEHTEAN